MTIREHDDFERALLASAKGDAMPADKKRALAAALSGATALGVAGTAKATTAAAAAAKKGGAGLALAKWIAAGAFGTALVAGAAKGVGHVVERSHDAPVTLAANEPRPRVPVPVAPVPPPKPTIADEPVVEPPQPPPAPPPVVRRPAAPAVRPIAEELAVIERARTALANGDVASAERALAEHDRDFKGGAFGDEARVLRIDALAKKGDRAGAAAAARAYLASNPDSPYAPRVRAYAGEGSAP